MPIRDRLKELRKAAGLTQQALAMSAGLSISLVIHLEAGRIIDPRASTLRALAKALGTTVDALLQDDQAEAPPEPPPPEPPAKGKGRKGGPRNN